MNFDDNDLSDLKITFEKDGYVIIKNFWSERLLSSWEKSLTSCYYIQALKIKNLKEKIGSKGLNPVDYDRMEDLDNVLPLFEGAYKAAGHQAIFINENTIASKDLCTYAPLLKIASSLLNCPPEIFNFSGPIPFINLPSVKRLLTLWHSEQIGYYAKRRNFLNIWFPFFRDKNEANGTMYFSLGSEKKTDWQFAEFQGYDEETMNKSEFLKQYTIPTSELESFEKKAVVANRKDLVIFNKNLVHTSSANTTAQPTYAAVMRIFDYRADLTHSFDPAVRPYADKYGFPGTEPLPLTLK